MAVASTRVINKVEEYVDTRIYEIALYLEAPRIHEGIFKTTMKEDQFYLGKRSPNLGQPVVPLIPSANGHY